MADSGRNEYLARIHRAQDFAERNLSEPISLEDMARAASFSPFHFHRIYSALMGETPYQFILRLRLERAASQLLQSRGKPVTAIALDCGFSSSATFARAFRGAYGMSASDWRERGCAEVPGNAIQASKKCKTVRNDGKAGEATAEYVEDVGEMEDTPSDNPLARRTFMPVAAQSVTVEHLDAMPVAYVRHVGPYAGDSALFDRLFKQIMAWAGPRGLIGRDTKSLCIYHDNPEITEPDKLRMSVCITVPAGTRTDPPVALMEIPAGKYVRARFEVAPDQFGGAWQWLMGTWFPSSGYQPDDGVGYELCLNDPSQHPQRKHIVELTMPVKPL